MSVPKPFRTKWKNKTKKHFHQNIISTKRDFYYRGQSYYTSLTQAVYNKLVKTSKVPPYEHFFWNISPNDVASYQQWSTSILSQPFYQIRSSSYFWILTKNFFGGYFSIVLTRQKKKRRKSPPKNSFLLVIKSCHKSENTLYQ